MGDWKEELRSLSESFLRVVSELHGRTYPAHVTQLAIAVRGLLALQERVNCWLESGLRKERNRRVELEGRLRAIEEVAENVGKEEIGWREEIDERIKGTGMWKGELENRMKGLEDYIMRKGLNNEDLRGSTSRKASRVAYLCTVAEDSSVLEVGAHENERKGHEKNVEMQAQVSNTAYIAKKARIRPTVRNSSAQREHGRTTINTVQQLVQGHVRDTTHLRTGANTTPRLQALKRRRCNAAGEENTTRRARVLPASRMKSNSTPPQVVENRAGPAEVISKSPVHFDSSLETPLATPLPSLPGVDQVLKDRAQRQAEQRATKRFKPLPCARCRLRKRAIMLREKGCVNEEVFERWAKRPGACILNVHQDEPPESPPSPFSFEETETESPSGVE